MVLELLVLIVKRLEFAGERADRTIQVMLCLEEPPNVVAQVEAEALKVLKCPKRIDLYALEKLLDKVDSLRCC